MIQTPEVGFLILLAGAICSPSLRRQMILPLGALALAIAGLRAGPGSPLTLSRESLTALPAGFRAVTAGLVLLGMLGTLAIVIRAGRTGIWLAAATVVAAWFTRDLVIVAPIGPSLLSSAIVAMLATIGLSLGTVTRIRRWVVEADRRWLGSPASASTMTSRGNIIMVAGMLCAMFAPHLSIVFLGALVASWSLWRINSARSRLPVLPALLTVLLVLIYFFLSTIGGPEGLSIAKLEALPVSPAAETLVAGVLLVASWLMSGLWPLHRWSAAALHAPLGIVILVRVGLVVAPTGLEHWRPIAAPVAMLALWHAAARRWGTGLTVGAAWLALVSVAPPPDGIVAAAWLLPAGLALEILGDDVDGRPRQWARRITLITAGWGGFLALESALHGEVVYTVLAALGVVLGMGGIGQAMTPRAPRTPAPSA